MFTSVSAFSPMLSGCASSFHPGSKADTFESEGKIIEPPFISCINASFQCPFPALTATYDKKRLANPFKYKYGFSPCTSCPGLGSNGYPEIAIFIGTANETALFSYLALQRLFPPGVCVQSLKYPNGFLASIAPQRGKAIRDSKSAGTL